MQGTIKERIKKKGRDSQGKIRSNIKVYDVYYRYKDNSTGETRPTVKRGFPTKSAAQNFLLDLNSKMVTNSFVTPKVVLFKDYLREWLDTYAKINLRQSTYIGYNRIINFHLIPHLGQIDLKDISPIQIDKLYAFLLQKGRRDGKGGLSAKTVQYTHRVLNEALEHAVKRQLIYHNPVKRITNIPRPKKFQSNIYTPEEILDLLERVKDTVFEVPVALAAICGLRRGECLALKVKDIDFINQEIYINKQLLSIEGEAIISEPKSEDSTRIVVVPQEVLDIISRHIAKNEQNKNMLQHEYDNQEFIICQADGKCVQPNVFSKNFSRFIERNKLKRIRFHDLRHSSASLMLKSGVDLKVSSQILGHSSIAITADLYTHVLKESKKEAAERVRQTLFGKNDKKEASPPKA
ncbi:site-specific integrase [Sporomusaceae bacterium FL31]|nr:site-specific integrase [Sporomusaceae bacterium FL31]GCE32816.1 site-specific integrase [Sporomusaceae bacterium]